MRKSVLTFFLMLLSIDVFAQRRLLGSEGVGGGDPKAIDFVRRGDKIAVWLSFHPELDVNAEQFANHVEQIRESLDNCGVNSRIWFQAEDVKCNFGSKMGCVDKNDVIWMNESRWLQSNNAEKLEAVALEVFELMKLESRYSLAQKIGEASAEIEEIKVNTPQKSQTGYACATREIKPGTYNAVKEHELNWYSPKGWGDLVLILERKSPKTMVMIVPGWQEQELQCNFPSHCFRNYEVPEKPPYSGLKGTEDFTYLNENEILFKRYEKTSWNNGKFGGYEIQKVVLRRQQ